MSVSTEYDNSIVMSDIIEEEDIHPDFDQIVRSILVSRAKYGATIEEIRDDYYNLIGEKFPYFANTTEHLLQLSNVICRTNEYGTRIFNILQSGRSQHIITMVQNQKQKKNNNNFYQSSLRKSTPTEKNNTGIDYNQNCFGYGNQDNNCFFEDNYQYLLKKLGTEEAAHIYDYQLMGDDFFLSMAKMELGCQYKTVNGIQQSGLCISGQTISEANNRVQTTIKLNRRLIVNIGSVDILQGHHLVDIQHDFLNLLCSLKLRGIQPILTTLAPLANHGHQPDIKRIVERFNEFIKNLGLPYVDVWQLLANEYGNTLYDCYQSGARYVTGSNHPHVFWNKIGRQRVLNNIKANLDYLTIG